MTTERYEVIGEEQDVAEWWKLADKAAQETNCTLSEDFGGSDLGDIVRAMKVLQRLTGFVSYSSASTGKPVIHIKDEAFFLSIPGRTRASDEETDYMTYKMLSKEYEGIHFEYMSEYAIKKDMEVVA